MAVEVGELIFINFTFFSIFRLIFSKLERLQSGRIIDWISILLSTSLLILHANYLESLNNFPSTCTKATTESNERALLKGLWSSRVSKRDFTLFDWRSPLMLFVVHFGIQTLDSWATRWMAPGEWHPVNGNRWIAPGEHGAESFRFVVWRTASLIAKHTWIWIQIFQIYFNSNTLVWNSSELYFSWNSRQLAEIAATAAKQCLGELAFVGEIRRCVCLGSG